MTKNVRKAPSRSLVLTLGILYILTPWSTVPLEMQTGFRLVKKKIPAFQGNRMFITAFTSARHLYPIRTTINPIYFTIIILPDFLKYFPFNVPTRCSKHVS